MKRTLLIHWFICLALGMSVGSCLSIAISNGSIIWGIFAIIATIASVLNIACGADTNKKSNED